jgi:nucleoside-diphosphate-sugar epimerase
VEGGGPVSVDLGNARILLTGGTGFVGQAILERLLSSHPGTTILVLARPRGAVSARQRVENLLRKPVFAPWLATVGEDEAQRRFAERVQVVEGDLGALGPEPERLDLVLHSASSVNFDDPIDAAFATNVSGVARLYRGLLDAGADPHVVHVSTAYVNAARRGLVTEGPVAQEVDWRAEEQAALSARARADERSRSPEELRRFLKRARQEVGKVGPQSVADATEAARCAWVDAELVEYGRARAQSLGWTDAYTLTKALAERLAEELWLGAGRRLSIVRPSIIGRGTSTWSPARATRCRSTRCTRTCGPTSPRTPSPGRTGRRVCRPGSSLAGSSSRRVWRARSSGRR